jgi:hypothetical protein
MLKYFVRSVVCGLWSAVLLLAGCGYTTRGCLYPERTIIIKAVTNEIDVTNVDYRSIGSAENPVLLEKELTTLLIKKFNLDGALRVTDNPTGALSLTCAIIDYLKKPFVTFLMTSIIPNRKNFILAFPWSLNEACRSLKKNAWSAKCRFIFPVPSLRLRLLLGAI